MLSDEFDTWVESLREQLDQPETPSDKIRRHASYLNGLTDAIPQVQTIIQGLLETADELEGATPKIDPNDPHSVFRVTELDVSISTAYLPEEHRPWFAAVFGNIVRQVDYNARRQTKRRMQDAMKYILGIRP